MPDVPVMQSAPAFSTARACTADGCQHPAVLQWSRLATPDELKRLTVPPGEDAVRLAVFGCADHVMDLESAAWLHGATCPWPDPCHCVEQVAAR